MMRILPSVRSWFQRLRDDRGAPAVEFAILSPLAIVMLLGVYDLGMAYNVRIQVERALNVALLSAFNGDAAEVQTSLQQQLERVRQQVEGFTITTAAAVVEAYGCPASRENADPVDAAQTEACDCDAANTCPYRYFQITATVNYDMPFGIDLDLPFVGSTSYLSEMEVHIDETVLADGGWSWS